MIVIDCEQRSPAWHEARRGIPTASRFGDMFAMTKAGKVSASRRNYAVELALQVITGRIAEGYVSRAMEQGTEREAAALGLYESRTRQWVDRVGFIRHDTLRCGASPDGVVLSPVRFGLEAKAPEPPAHLEYLDLPLGCCPDDYEWQVHGQMWLGEFPWVDFISYNPDFPPELQLVIRRVLRSESKADQLRVEIPIFLREVDAIVQRIEAKRAAAVLEAA